MDTITWRAQVQTALAAAEARAHRGDRRIACGFTNNVDIIVDLDTDQLARLYQAGAVRPATEEIGFAATPDRLVAGILRLMQRGQGGEIALTSDAVFNWVSARFDGRRQLGGTGAQAAQTLACLGFDALVHLTSLSPRQASLMNDGGHLLVATPTGLQRPAAAACATDPTLINFIFEYPAGLTVLLPDLEFITPHANRVIVSYGSLNTRVPIDPLFFAAIAHPDNRVDRVLISGLSQITDVTTAKSRIAEATAAISTWRQSGRALFVHLELAAIPEPAVAAAILSDLPHLVDSIGCNADELRALLAAQGMPISDDVEEIVRGLLTLQYQLGCARLGLHTQDYCLTLTRHDPAAERDALLYASLVAGTRARIGTYPTPAQLRTTLSQAEPSPTGVAAIKQLVATLDLHHGMAKLDDAWLVAVPTLAVPCPAGTVGLGDSFTGGLLAML